MKSTVNAIISQAVSVLQETKTILLDVVFEINVKRTKVANHGDYATNLALILAKPCRQSPQQLARLFVQTFSAHPLIERTEVAGPGFINFFISSVARTQIIENILMKGLVFGFSDADLGICWADVSAYSIEPPHGDTIQYAYARISSLFRQVNASDLRLNEAVGLLYIHLLVASHEVTLISLLGRYKEVVDTAVSRRRPHLIADYLHELAKSLHSYYNAIPLLCQPAELRNARLCLLKSVGYVLHNGVRLLGVSFPESVCDV